MKTLIYENKVLREINKNDINEDFIFIDFVSDIHIDLWNVNSYEEKAKELKESSQNKSKYLIIAGDISNSNKQSYKIIKKLSELWDKIYIISGNHDFYNQKPSENRYLKLRKRISLSESRGKVEFFDENVINIEGVNIFGSFMIYDIKDINTYFMFKFKMNDSRFLSDEMAERLFNKSVTAYNNYAISQDIIVSHIPIAVKQEDLNINQRKYGLGNECYVNKSVDIFKDKLYIHGHSHKRSFGKSDSGAYFANVSIGYEFENPEYSVTTIGFPKKEYYVENKG